MLLLFDIDGTLLQRASAEQVQAMRLALHEVWGVTAEAKLETSPAGRTDPDIARGMLLRAGVSAERIDERMDAFCAACVEEYARHAPADLSPCLVPGIAPVLERLAARPGVVMGLVTGNLEAIARLKLSAAGILAPFEPWIGGFGSDSEDRTDLPPIARRRAGGETPYPRGRTLIIGDTPRDIACARSDGIGVIAVTTGPVSAEELGAADAVASSARELERALDGFIAG
jgi:phosphoglycolate phosphatase